MNEQLTAASEQNVCQVPQLASYLAQRTNLSKIYIFHHIKSNFQGLKDWELSFSGSHQSLRFSGFHFQGFFHSKQGPKKISRVIQTIRRAAGHHGVGAIDPIYLCRTDLISHASISLIFQPADLVSLLLLQFFSSAHDVVVLACGYFFEFIAP